MQKLFLWLSVVTVLFNYDIGFSEVIVNNYSQLRNLSASSAKIVQLVAPRIAGTFKWQQSPQNNWNDNTGISFPANNGGYWVRDFSYSRTEPIELDWFELTDGTEITILLEDLAGAYRPALFLRAPTAHMMLICNYIDFSLYPISDFSFLESTASVNIQQNKATSVKRTLWYFQDARVFIGGPNLTLSFRGVHEGIGDGIYETQAGLLFFHQTRAVQVDSIRVSTNISDAYARSVSVEGGGGAPNPYPVTNVNLKGSFYNGNFLVSWVKNLNVDNVLVSDPYGRNCGWNGQPYPDNVVLGRQDIVPGGYVRTRGVHIYNVQESVTGVVTLEYGFTTWGLFSNTPYIGSVTTPFTIKYRSLGYAYNGSQIDCRKNLYDVAGKMDGAGDYPYGQRYIKLVDLSQTEGYGFALRYGFSLEATRDICTVYKTNNIDITIQDVDAKMNGFPVSVLEQYGKTCPRTGDPDESRGHRIHGQGRIGGILYLGENHEVDSGSWETIRFYLRTFDDSPIWEKQGYPPAYQPCSNSSVRNLTISKQVIADTSCVNNLVDNVIFTSTGDIISVAPGSKLRVNNICAAVGSRISGGGDVWLDGQKVTIPYFITTNDQKCNNTTPPVSSIDKRPQAPDRFRLNSSIQNTKK